VQTPLRAGGGGHICLPPTDSGSQCSCSPHIQGRVAPLSELALVRCTRQVMLLRESRFDGGYRMTAHALQAARLPSRCRGAI
jgi:hypothetical protein